MSETFCQTNGVHVLKGNENKNVGVSDTFCQTHGVHESLQKIQNWRKKLQNDPLKEQNQH